MKLLPAAVYTCDAPSGIITYYSRRAAELWGRAPAVGETDEAFCRFFRHFRTDGTSLSYAETPMAQVLKGSWLVRDQELVVERPDGSRITVMVDVDPIANAAGEIVGAVSTIQDITEQKRLFDALRQSEQRYRLVAEAANDFIWDWDLVTNEVTRNDGVRKLFGYEADQIPGNASWEQERLHPDDRERVLRNILSAIEDGKESWQDRYRFRRADGTYAEVLARGQLLRDENGKPARMVGSMMDLTERQHAEQTLRESEERLRLATQAGKVGVWDWDIITNRLSWTDSLYAIHGVSPDEFETTVEGFTSLVHPGDRDLVCRAIENALEKGAPYEIEFRAVRPSGEVIWLFTDAAVLREGERPVRMLGATMDITERKQVEQMLRQSEEKFRQQAKELEQQLIASGRLVSLGEVTASMAHEFNNPLGIIIGFVEEMLTGTNRSDPNYHSLQIIDEEAKRCKKIVADLMEFARPRSTELSLINIQEVIEKTLKLVENHLYKQKVMPAMNVDANLPLIHADPQQLAQVLVNLYLNAIDAMPKGGNLVVGATLDGPDQTNPMVMIKVADTGLGLDKTELSKIFQPFYTAKKRRGLGLGLPICERIIKNHGGRIEVESQPGKGAMFKVYLPMNHESQE